MKAIKLLATLIFFHLAAVWCCADEQPAVAGERYELKLIGIYEGSKPEYIFVIGESGFRTVESLKRFLAGRPKGTEVKWAPGCTRMGDEPLLSSGAEMQQFRSFLEEHGIKFVLVPSG